MSPHFAKYDRLGDYHWDEFNCDTPYRQHALHVQQWITEQCVLDIGAGDGLITHLLIEKGLQATGIDDNHRAVQLAGQHGIPVTHGNAYHLSGKYDAVYLGDVLEQLEHQSEIIRKISRITNVLYIATPPRGLYPTDEFHIRECTQSELRTFMEAHGWRQTGSTVANARILARFVRDPIVVYTAIFGGKDDLHEPTVVPLNCEFTCFSDRKMDSDTWNIVLERPQSDDPCRAAKMYKILPHRFFTCNRSVWLDGAFQLTGDVNDLFANSTHDFAVFQHESRDCIYDEARACIALYKDDPSRITHQVERYRQDGYPENNGLVTCGVLFRTHTQPAEELNELWWSEIVSESRRDQLSFNYVAWKTNLQYSVIPGIIWHNTYVVHRQHCM